MFQLSGCFRHASSGPAAAEDETTYTHSCETEIPPCFRSSTVHSINANMQTCAHRYIGKYSYIHTYIHTYVHTYVHTYI